MFLVLSIVKKVKTVMFLFDHVKRKESFESHLQRTLLGSQSLRDTLPLFDVYRL